MRRRKPEPVKNDKLVNVACALLDQHLSKSPDQQHHLAEPLPEVLRALHGIFIPSALAQRLLACCADHAPVLQLLTYVTRQRPLLFHVPDPFFVIARSSSHPQLRPLAFQCLGNLAASVQWNKHAKVPLWQHKDFYMTFALSETSVDLAACLAAAAPLCGHVPWLVHRACMHLGRRNDKVDGAALRCLTKLVQTTQANDLPQRLVELEALEAMGRVLEPNRSDEIVEHALKCLGTVVYQVPDKTLAEPVVPQLLKLVVNSTKERHQAHVFWILSGMAPNADALAKAVQIFDTAARPVQVQIGWFVCHLWNESIAANRFQIVGIAASGGVFLLCQMVRLLVVSDDDDLLVATLKSMRIVLKLGGVPSCLQWFEQCDAEHLLGRVTSPTEAKNLADDLLLSYFLVDDEEDYGECENTQAIEHYDMDLMSKSPSNSKEQCVPLSNALTNRKFP